MLKLYFRYTGLNKNTLKLILPIFFFSMAIRNTLITNTVWSVAHITFLLDSTALEIVIAKSLPEFES